MLKRLFLSFLALVLSLGGGQALAQQPATWRYDFQGGIATATYPGNVVVNGEISWPDGPYVNVKSPPYNAKGDGVTDDTSSIQAAVNSVAATGGLVVFPKGQYLTSAPIDITGMDGVALVGVNQDATEIFGNGNFPVILDNATYASGDVRNAVRNMSIRCGGKANASASGIKMTYVNSGLIDTVTFYACNRAMELYDQWQTILTNIRVVGEGTDQTNVGLFMGVPSDATNPDPNNAVVATNITIQHVAEVGMQLQYFAGSKMANIEMMNGVNGMLLCQVAYANAPTIPCRFGHFVNVLTDTTSASGIDLQQGANANPVRDIMFDSVWIGNSFQYGMYAGGVTYSSFKDFHITSADYGVVLQNSNHLSLTADIRQFNRSNSGAMAVTLDGTTDSFVQAMHNQSDFAVTGYNGIEEINGASGNEIWGGLSLNCTPGVTFGGAATGLVYDSRSCSYEVRGRHVKFNYYIDLSAKGSSVGSALITGLPFAVDTIDPAYGSTGVVLGTNMATIAGAIIAEGGPGLSTLNLYNQGATGLTSIADTNFTNSSVLYGTIEYEKP